MSISVDTERLARAMFSAEQVPDVLEIVGWYDDVQPEDVHRAVLRLSKGDLDALFNFVAAAVTDYRDVMMWESQPEPTTQERAAARARAQEMVREYQRARRRSLEARFGIEGAAQIERSNRKLFGIPSPEDHHLEAD